MSTSSRTSAKFQQKNHQNLSKNQRKEFKNNEFCKILQKNAKKFDEICWNIVFWAVQKHVNLVDLVKSFLTSINYVVAKVGVDTPENEPLKVWRWFNSFIHSPPSGRRDGRRASERRGGRSGVARHRGGVGPKEPNEFSAIIISKISGNVAAKIWPMFCKFRYSFAFSVRCRESPTIFHQNRT